LLAVQEMQPTSVLAAVAVLVQSAVTQLHLSAVLAAMVFRHLLQAQR
jgi:hypothetical protein